MLIRSRVMVRFNTQSSLDRLTLNLCGFCAFLWQTLQAYLTLEMVDQFVLLASLGMVRLARNINISSLGGRNVDEAV